MKRLLLLLAILIIPVLGYCYTTPGGNYSVTLNTTTFTTQTGLINNTVVLYNPGAYDIKLATASSSVAAARTTIKAASYFPVPILIQTNLYFLATDTNSATIEITIIK